MRPWEHDQQQEKQPAVIRSDPDADEDEETVAPPRQYFEAGRALLPSSTKGDALRAWDQTAPVGSAGSSGKDWDLETGRMPAALGALLDLCTSEGQAAANSAGSFGSTKRPRTRTPSPRRASSSEPNQALFRSSSPDVLVLSSLGSKRAGLSSGAALGASRIAEGKGKAKEELILEDSDDEGRAESPMSLDDDEDNERIEIVSPLKARRNKGKGRASSSPRLATPPDGLDLAAASSDNEMFLPRASSSPASPSSRRLRSLSSTGPEPVESLSPLAQVLAIIPDVLPDHASSFLNSSEPVNNVEQVIDALLAAKDYPKAKGEDEVEAKEPEKDWMDIEQRKRDGDNPSVLYRKMALDNLYTSFPLLPTTLIKPLYLQASSSFFAPAYLTLHTAQEKGEYDAKKLKKARKAPKKVYHFVRREVEVNGVVQEMEVEEEEQTPEELRREMEWMRAKIDRERRLAHQAQLEKDAAEKEAARIEMRNERARQRGEAVECQCCFDEVAPANTASCDGGHLFCKTCCAANASDRLGKRVPTLPCMAPDCTSLFPPSSWSDFLPLKTIEGLERLAQENEVSKAFEGIEGFESCPFCPFACYIENADERLFHCQREDCKKVSCRKCKKKGHVPLSCEEADADRRRGGVHAVAESMTAAFIRKCPKCKIPTAKIDGCNHMICSQCQAHWCYVCRELIKGYEHFNDRGGKGACPTFDDTSKRNFDEIEAARLTAEAKLDDLTRADTAKLAAENPRPNAPIAGPAYHHPQAAPNPRLNPYAQYAQYGHAQYAQYGHAQYAQYNPFVGLPAPQPAGGVHLNVRQVGGGGGMHFGVGHPADGGHRLGGGQHVGGEVHVYAGQVAAPPGAVPVPDGNIGWGVRVNYYVDGERIVPIMTPSFALQYNESITSAVPDEDTVLECNNNTYEPWTFTSHEMTLFIRAGFHIADAKTILALMFVVNGKSFVAHDDVGLANLQPGTDSIPREVEAVVEEKGNSEMVDLKLGVEPVYYLAEFDKSSPSLADIFAAAEKLKINGAANAKKDSELYTFEEAAKIGSWEATAFHVGSLSLRRSLTSSGKFTPILLASPAYTPLVTTDVRAPFTPITPSPKGQTV
ncbi:hypothetical protein JCM8547_001961 [Rhodosporidiobolus lusitaniae]